MIEKMTSLSISNRAGAYPVAALVLLKGVMMENEPDESDGLFCALMVVYWLAVAALGIYALYILLLMLF